MADASSSGGDFEKPQTVVVAGAGVIGLSTAYYLAKNHGVKTLVVDPSGQVAPAASGKAGGFLALDWNDGSPVGPLARRSFALHQELADELGADKIQYRRLTCAAIAVGGNALQRRPSGKKLDLVEWAQEGDKEESAVLGARPMGNEETIAQVHPKLLCDALWEVASTEAGSELVEGEVQGPIFADDDDKVDKKLVGVQLKDGRKIDADALLWACGPWTSISNDLSLYGVKYHSVIVPTPRVLSQAVFFSGCGDPEVYPRPDGTAYCTGFPDGAVQVTERPGHEEVREEAVERIVASVRMASGQDGALRADPTVTQSCYLPTTMDGTPIMGPVEPSDDDEEEQPNVYVAAGHTCWGILNGPATGETMASLIATGKPAEHFSLLPFHPARLTRRGALGR